MGDNEMTEQLVHEICRRVGYFGNLLSMSKSGYRDRNPDHLVIFNANIITEHEKIWYGDIDISISGETLLSLANAFGVDIYVLYEIDARFDNEDNPKIGNYVIKFNQDNTYVLSEKISNSNYKLSF